MCDYSLYNVRSRAAKVGDELTTRQFNLGTRGFSAPEDARVAVCLRPGTELCLRKTLGGRVCGHGLRELSTTRRRSFGKSIRTRSTCIMMPWNFPMVRLCC